MITPAEAKQWIDYPQFTAMQKRIVEMRADLIDEDLICEKLHITRTTLERMEDNILTEMDCPF